MTNQIYTFYNRLSKRYGDCFAYPSDEFCQARISELVQADKVNPGEVEICRIGEYDIQSGMITPIAPVRIDIPLKPNALPVNPPAKEV